jgi:DNA-binding response OmpR family regulator
LEEERLVELKNLSILVVDDNEDLLNSLSKILSIFFKKVFKANNGEIALNVFQENEIDVVLTDYVMPVVDGYELVRNIREQDKDVQIIIMSSHSDKDKLLKAISLDLVNYLVKPINYSTIIATLMSVIFRGDKKSLIFEKLSGKFTYNKKTQELFFNEKKVSLTKGETKLVDFLIKNRGRPISKLEISQQLSTEEKFKSEQSIKNIVNRLKLKFEEDLILSAKEVSGYIIK